MYEVDYLVRKQEQDPPVAMVSMPVHWGMYEDIHDIPHEVVQYLKNASHGSVLQYPHWHLFTSDKAERYKAIAAFRGGTPVFAALIHMSPFPGLHAFQGSVDRGPVFDDETLAIALWEDFESQTKKWGLCSLEVHPFWKREQSCKLREYLESSGYIKCQRVVCHTETLVVDLHPPEEEIFKAMKSSRNRIRKAISMGVEVRPAQNLEEIKGFWQMYRDMCHSKGLSCSPCRLFGNIYRFSLAHPNDCVFLLGWLDKVLIGGYILLRHGNIVEITRGGASTSADPQIPKTDLIFWEAIRWAKSTGASYCDLGGITPDAEEGSAKWNINRFKKKFSDQQISLFEPMEKIFNPRLNGLHDVLKRFKRSVINYLPL